MSRKSEAKKIIRTLEENHFHAGCPHCDETFPLKEAGLFHLDDFSPEGEELYDEMLDGLKEQRKELRERREQISKRSETTTRAVNIGFVLERIAPAMEGFGFDRNDCRSLFDPIDYVVFEGLAEKGRVSRIIFADIKTGAARLSARQREIRDLVENKQVELDVYERE